MQSDSPLPPPCHVCLRLCSKPLRLSSVVASLILPHTTISAPCFTASVMPIAPRYACAESGHDVLGEPVADDCVDGWVCCEARDGSHTVAETAACPGDAYLTLMRQRWHYDSLGCIRAHR